MKVKKLEGIYIKANYLLGHPAFKGALDVTVRVSPDGQVFYNNKPIQLAREGRKALKLDYLNIK